MKQPINSFDDDATRRIIETVRRDEQRITNRAQDRSTAVSPSIGAVELWGYTTTEATASETADNILTPGEGTLQVYRRTSTGGYAATSEMITFQNFGEAIDAQTFIRITRDRAARRWVAKEVATEALTIDRVTACGQSLSRQLLITWEDQNAGTSNGAAVVTYTESPIGAVSWSEGWEGVAFTLPGPVDSGDEFGMWDITGPNDYEIRYAGMGCVGGSWQVVLGTAVGSGFADWNATPLFFSAGQSGGAPISFNYSSSPDDVDFTITEVYGVGVSWEKNTAAGWAAENPTLSNSYIGIESDTGKYKIGDGSTAWNDLDYANPANVAAADIADATADGIALITSADANPFTDDDESKLDGIEALADVTDATNVTAAGALMDSEVTNLSQVKAFDSSDYATAAQGTLADSAIQPGDLGAVATSNDYDDLSSKPTLGTAAAAATGDFATAAQGTTADSALQDIVDDTTPQLGGDLDAQANSITDLANVTFRTGASGGTLRTGTTAADKFILSAYDVDGAAYTTMLQANAGNSPSLLLPVDTLNLADATDTTKVAQFDASGITTATTRTFTLPDESGTIALTGGTVTLPSTKCRDTTAGQTISHATGTKLNLDSTDWDDDSIQNIASNEITVGADGKYLVVANWGAVDSNLDQLLAGIAVNGTVVIYCGNGVHVGSVATMSASKVLDLSNGDDISIYGYILTDDSSSITTSSNAAYQPTLQVIRLS